MRYTVEAMTIVEASSVEEAENIVQNVLSAMPENVEVPEVNVIAGEDYDLDVN